MACHVRSISLPTRPHSLFLKVEQDLEKLRTFVASSPSTAVPRSVFQELGDLYQCIDKLLDLPSNQETLSHSQQKKWVERELDCSVSLLDLCNFMRDNLAVIKEQFQDLQSALRRGDETTIQSKMQAFIHSLKKANKDVKKGMIRSFKEESELPNIAGVLIEAREITISFLQSVISSLSRQIIKSKPKNSKWSLVSKKFEKRSCKDLDVERVLKPPQNQWQDLEVNIENLESGLECLYRHLIRCRVSLLNICSS